jgi:SAM-dependent methyltransferase
MKEHSNYLELNKDSWNKRTEVHFDSEFYDNPSFIKGKSSLNDIELNLLGDIKGLSVLHLQCHFGQDTISLNRLGAKVTGVDLSDKAIEKANELAVLCDSDAKFICCDVYNLAQVLDKKFDIVFTSYGTIGWLPDIDKWAKTVSHFLKPNGRFIFAEFHPVVWMFDDNFSKIDYRYFNSEAIVESQTETYTDQKTPIQQTCISWNHGLGEVVSSLLKNELQLNSLEEFDYSPYDCFAGTVKVAQKKFRIKRLDDKIPMVYAISATKI